MFGRHPTTLNSSRQGARRPGRAEPDPIRKIRRPAIESIALDALSRLIESNLESSDAKGFLATIPTGEQLMPMLEVEQTPEVRKRMRGWVALASGVDGGG